MTKRGQNSMTIDTRQGEGEHPFRAVVEGVPGEVLFPRQTAHRPADVFGVHEQVD